MNRIASHMVKGMMIHEQLAEYYLFLNLKGYARCHEYHFMEETCCYRKFCKYYMKHHQKLIKTEIDIPEVVPENWFNHVRSDVDANTIQNAVKNGLKMWIDWETETKELYETSYKELMEKNAVADAMYVGKLIKEVNKELEKAESYMLTKKAVDYNMSEIIGEQKHKHDKYVAYTKQVGEKLC